MIKKILVISLFTLSCFAVSAEKTTILDTRPTLNLNKPVGSAVAQQFASHKLNYTSTTKDLLTRSLVSFATGALVGAGVGSAVNRGHIIGSQRTMYATAAAATVPYFAFTFYPGSTSFDKGSLFDFTLITVGRGLCNFLLYGLGVNMGLKWSVGVGLSELI